MASTKFLKISKYLLYSVFRFLCSNKTRASSGLNPILSGLSISIPPNWSANSNISLSPSLGLPLYLFTPSQILQNLSSNPNLAKYSAPSLAYVFIFPIFWASSTFLQLHSKQAVSTKLKSTLGFAYFKNILAISVLNIIDLSKLILSFGAKKYIISIFDIKSSSFKI